MSLLCAANNVKTVWSMRLSALNFIGKIYAFVI